MLLFRPVMVDKDNNGTFFDAVASFDKSVSIARSIHAHNLNCDVFVWVEIWPTLNRFYYYFYVLTGNADGFGTEFSLKYKHKAESFKRIWESDKNHFLLNNDPYQSIQSNNKSPLPLIFILALIAFLFYGLFFYQKDNVPNKLNRELAFALADKLDNTPPKNDYIYSVKAPNGEDWPKKASYIKGYIKENNNGLSKLTINNSQNNSDIFVKLCDISTNPPHRVRHIFIPAGQQFTIRNISSGIYDVRYKDLNTGKNAKSESVQLEETNTIDGVNYSVVEMTIYKVINGNMQMTPISENDF